MNDTGHVTIYASSWMYGHEVKDSLPFFAGWGLYVYLHIIMESYFPAAVVSVYVFHRSRWRNSISNITIRTTIQGLILCLMIRRQSIRFLMQI